MKFDFCTVTWGDWHTGVFLNVNLPSLLAEGNLPAFAKEHDVRYRIFTSTRDKAIIQAHPAYKQAAEIVPFKFIDCPLENVENPIGMHHALWNRSVGDARKAKRKILFVPPDVIWSRDGFGNIAKRFSEGKIAVFMTYVRVLSETCVPAVQSTYGHHGSAVLDISSRDLVNMAFEHIHPLSLAYVRHSANFPIHPEFILWPVKGEGYLMRVLVREMFAYDPNLIDLNRNALPAHTLDPDDVHFITDSDELFALSLAPLQKDLEWIIKPQRLDPIRLASWWLTYDSPANDLSAAQYFHVHHLEMTADKWRRVDQESDVLMSRLKGTREILRIISQTIGSEYEIVRQLAFTLLGTAKWVRLARNLPPSTLLVPRDEACVRWLAGGGRHIVTEKSQRPLWNLFLEHTVPGRLILREGQDMTLETANGGHRKLTWQNRQKGNGSTIAGPHMVPAGSIFLKDESELMPLIDGIPARVVTRRIGPHVLVEVDSVLPGAEHATTDPGGIS